MKVIGKIIKGLLVVAFLMIVCVSGIFIYKGYNMYKNAVEEMSIEDKVNEIRAKENYTKIEELPEIYLEAIISVEDHRFYEHWGVDVLATLRAAYNDIRACHLWRVEVRLHSSLLKIFILPRKRK